MKKLIVILSFAVMVGCATTQPPAPVSHNTEQARPENQSEEAKKLGKEIAEDSFWVGFSIFMSHALNVWPF